MPGDKNQHFQKLVDAGQPVGEVTSVNKFLINLRGLQPVNSHSVIIFEDGSKGFIQHILEDEVVALQLGSTVIRPGMLAAVQSDKLQTNVGRDYVGRVVTIFGEPLDGKGAIAADTQWPVFNPAPPINSRELLDQQLETGVTLIDTLFPIVRGQRLALLGDSKSGKTTLATQIALNQKNTDQIVIYVLVAKRQSDIEALVSRLKAKGSMEKAIVVVATAFDSLTANYLAPYVGCALGEYLWQQANQDVLVIYDDLTTHAQIYREISLISGASPGRDSYPGDIFYAHSSLLERAGKLKSNRKSLTAIPLVLAEGGDITAYLPTNVMSITDGQWILDMDVFREGLRPAVSTGLSVTRVGDRGHNKMQKQQNQMVTKALAAYNEAQQYAAFGTDIAQNSQKDLAIGRLINDLMTQQPNETYSLMAQQLMLGVLLETGGFPVNTTALKQQAAESAKLVKSDADFAAVKEQIKSQVLQPAGRNK